MGFELAPGFALADGFALAPGFALANGFAIDPQAGIGGGQTLLAQLIQALVAEDIHGWVFDPSNTFVESAGTGTVADGSPVGYVNNLNPNYAARVERLGPELVTNGDFSNGAAGWNLGAGFSISGDSLNAASVVSLTQAITVTQVVAGKTYTMQVACTSLTSGSFRLRAFQPGMSVVSSTYTAAGVAEFSFVALVTGNCSVVVQALAINGDLTATFDNISVREVLPAERYGPELVVNGDFSNGTAGWTPAGGSIAAVGDQLVLTSSGAGFAVRAQSGAIPVQIGKRYRLSANQIAGTGPAIRVGTTAGGTDLGQSFSTPVGQTNSLEFVATQNTAFVSLTGANVNGTTTTFDNVSLTEVLSLPLRQDSTPAKPVMRRVPIKFGPELVSNGDFSAGAKDWTTPAGWAVSGGVATKSSANNNPLGAASSFQAGKTYATSFTITAVTTAGSGISARIGTGGAGSAIGGFNGAVGTYTDLLTPTADLNGFQIVPRGATGDWIGSVDNVSVREVLEWGWAIDCDGLNDFLSTALLPAAAAETMIVAGQFQKLDSTLQTMVWKRSGNNGFSLRLSNNASVGAVLTGSSIPSINYRAENNTPAIYEISAKNLDSTGRLNGVQVGALTNAYAASATPLSIGGEAAGGTPFKGYAFALFYAAKEITPATRSLISRFCAQLSGVTLP
jgi:hypothetical protein